jgi:hypothetical protein
VRATAVPVAVEGGVSTAVAVAVIVGGMGVFVGVFGIANVGGGVGDSFIKRVKIITPIRARIRRMIAAIK